MGHELCGTIVEVNPRATENGFAVGDKVVHHAGQPHNVGWVQTDRWLIQYV